MRKLSVYIEINGMSEYVGEIAGSDFNDACFTYAESYLKNPEHRAISIGLPKEEKTFDSVHATVQIGLGTKMAMKRFDAMVSGFSDAINQAKADLKQQGFEQVEQISEQIMKKGGIWKEIM